MTRFMTWLLGAWALCAAAAQAQDLPAGVLGTYAAGPKACGAPDAVLHLTPRSVVTWEKVGDEAGNDRLIRIDTTRAQGDWLLATGTGDDLPRVLLRQSGEGDQAGIDEVVPSEKMRDDQLPGDTPPRHFVRCTTVPPAFAALHGEGLAFLHALETMEPACTGNDLKACGDAFMAYADVTKDGKLTAAELARVGRGATWVAQMAIGTRDAELAVGMASSALVSLAAAEILVHSYDYDGSGSITLDELLKDRLPLVLVPPARTAGAPPLPLDQIVPGLHLLEGMSHNLGL
jgi:hypothetical protein